MPRFSCTFTHLALSLAYKRKEESELHPKPKLYNSQSGGRYPAIIACHWAGQFPPTRGQRAAPGPARSGCAHRRQLRGPHWHSSQGPTRLRAAGGGQARRGRRRGAPPRGTRANWAGRARAACRSHGAGQRDAKAAGSLPWTRPGRAAKRARPPTSPVNVAASARSSGCSVARLQPAPAGSAPSLPLRRSRGGSKLDPPLCLPT